LAEPNILFSEDFNNTPKVEREKENSKQATKRVMSNSN
jgi:hypothetical protein